MIARPMWQRRQCKTSSRSERGLGRPERAAAQAAATRSSPAGEPSRRLAAPRRPSVRTWIVLSLTPNSLRHPPVLFGGPDHVRLTGARPQESGGAAKFGKLCEPIPLAHDRGAIRKARRNNSANSCERLFKISDQVGRVLYPDR